MCSLLSLPDKAMAWTSLNLRSSLNRNWEGTNDAQFTQNGDANKWKKEIDVSSLNADFYFRIYVSDGEQQIYPTSDPTEISVGGSTSELNFDANSTKNSWKISNPSSTYSKITIYAEYSSNAWTVRVEGTPKGGGGAAPTYKLMSGNIGTKGSQVATFTGSNFPYTVTYDINSTGKYYFYVNDGSQDYLNDSKAFSDGTDVQVYPYGTSNYGHMIKLEAQTTGTYTFTFNKSEENYYLKCVYPTSTPTPSGGTYYLVGDIFGGWSTDKGKQFDSNGEVTVTFENTSTASQFKILSSDGKTWYGSANTVTSTSNNITLSTSVTDNAKIKIERTGTYTFKMTEGDNGTISLVVTYPEISTALPENLKFQSDAENNWQSKDMNMEENNTKWTYTLDMSNSNKEVVWFRFIDPKNSNACVLANSNGVEVAADGNAHNVAYLRPNSTTNNFKFYTTGAKKYTIVAQESDENWSVTITPDNEQKTEYVLDCNDASYSPMQSGNEYTFTLPKSAFTSSGLSFSIAKTTGTSTTYLSATTTNTFSGHDNSSISNITDNSTTAINFSYTTSGTDVPSGDITVKYDASGKTLTLNYESQQSVISGSYYVVFPDANVGNTARADKTVTNIPPDHTAFRLIPSRNRNANTLDTDLVSINLKIDGDKGRQLRYDTEGNIKFYITDGSGNYFKKNDNVTGGKDYLHAFANGTNLGGQIANNGVDYYNTRSGSMSNTKPDYYYTIHKDDAQQTKSLTFMFSNNNNSNKEYTVDSDGKKIKYGKASNSVDGFGDEIKSGNLIVGFLTSRGYNSAYYTNHISKGVYLVGKMDGTSYTHNKKYPMKQILYPLGTTEEKADSIVYSCTVKKGSADWDEFFLSFSTGDKVEDGNNLWNLLLRPNVQNQMDGQALEGGVTFFKNDNGTDNAQQALNPLLSEAQKNRYVSYTIYFNATYSTYRIEFHDGFYIAGPAVEESGSYAPENRIAMSSAELNGKQHYIYTGKFLKGQPFAFFLNEDSYTLNYCEDNNAVSPTSATDAWYVQAPEGGADYAFYNHVQYNTTGSNENKDLGDGKSGMIWGLPTGTYTIRFYNHKEETGNNQLYTVDKEVTMANATSSYKNSETDETETEHNNGGWRTFSDDCALLLPNGVTAYYAAKVQNGKVYFKEVPNGYIPAHCPVIISNPNLLAGNKSIAFPVRPEGYDVTLAEGEKNYLVDCYKEAGTVNPEVTENDTKKYNYFFAHKYKFYGSKVMSGVPLGFWKTFNNAATKKNYTYLSVDTQLNPSKYEQNTFTYDENETVESTKAYCFRMVFDEDELGDNTTTGIEQVKENAEMDMTNAVWHNMQGVRIRKPSAPGMYICNGKKVVVR